jgi:hypothetical protein
MSINSREKIRVGIGNYLYAAYANDRETGSLTASTFADAVTMHKLIDLISEAASSGRQRAVAF